jgi:hypothetical protein
MDIVERHYENADLFINLGDGEDDVDSVLALYPMLKIERVAGNCDWGSNLPLMKTIKFAGKKIFFTHGHPFYVKHGYGAIEDRAKLEGADICLFGHTHIPYTNCIDGIYYLNPGSVADGSYGIIDIENGSILCYNATI